jgi:hypothetical protein
MDKTIAVDHQWPPVWKAVNQIQEDVETAMADRTEALREAVVMTATELMENAVKYSADPATDGRAGIRFQMSADDSRIRITVSNHLASVEERVALRLGIEQIQASKDPRLLYIHKLYDLMNRPGARRTRLGLYRIAYEGGFRLACQFDDDRATVVATRDLSS